MPSLVCPTSDASRPMSGILTPTSDGSLNRIASDHVSSSDSRKRKRGASGLPMEDMLKPTIVVKPHPSSLHAKPRILHPMMLLPREHLPLSSLDLSMPHGDFSACRFYESRIKILDLEGRLGSNLLLARSETNRIVYAIERQGDGLYVLCKLGPWVDVGSLVQFATVACGQRLRSYSAVPKANDTPLPLTTPQLHKDNKRRRLAIEEIQSMVKKRPRSQSVATAASQDPVHNATPVDGRTNGPTAESQLSENPVLAANAQPQESHSQAFPASEPTDESLSQTTAEGIFNNIRSQYLEALYHSMGSLAYFAKGPLSRARAAFHLDCDASLEMNDLIGFLQSLVMNTVLIDKKYRETVPEITSKMKTLVEESDNGGPKSKKRKPKKMKIGKDGLYPLEENHIRRWWNLNKPSEQSVTPEEVKYHISCLRKRETQLQMIVILEILALEPLSRPTDATEESQLPGMGSQVTPQGATAEAPVKRRNKHNFPVLLDVHADRLCIWQSTTLDEVKALAESQVTNHGQQTERTDRPNSDPLKDFCVDIILPFFSARLPDLCDSISRKLGGPVIKAPASAKPASQSKPKPGAPAKKSTASRKGREKTLERVLSNERMRRSLSRGPTDAIALMRSASATTIPGLKRETSETLLGTVPKKQPAPVRERSSNLFSRAASQSSVEDEKAKKKASLEAELKDAISALKKPNRALAGKAIVEDAEKRTSSSLSQLKKARKPTRISSVPTVQVKATPANNRFRDAMPAHEPRVPGLSLPEIITDEMDAIPSSSSVVPSSTAPKRVAMNILDSPAITITTTPTAGKIQATPAARLPPIPAPMLRVPSGGSPAIPPSSPILTRKAAVAGGHHHQQQHHLFVARSHVGAASPSPRPAGGLFETPLKPRSAMGGGRSGDDDVAALAETPEPVRPLRLAGGGKPAADAKQQLTIYQTLGWDDDDDDF